MAGRRRPWIVERRPSPLGGRRALALRLSAGFAEGTPVGAGCGAEVRPEVAAQIDRRGESDPGGDGLHGKVGLLEQHPCRVEAAAEVGALAGGADEDGRMAMREYGLELGLAFQLVDDVLDHRGERGTLGKNTGDDLREGKMTLPVILAIAEANPAERDIVVATLGNPDASETAVAQIVSIFNRHRTLDRTIEKAQRHVDQAREALKPLPASEMRTLLSDIAEFYLSRAY